jgi:DNA-binding transcriptional regulator YhcF (GntR family)
MGSRKKCALSSSKVRAALKKQTAGRSAKSYRELGWKIQVHHNTVKKYLTKIRVHRKAKKSARQQSVIKARLKLLTQNFFSAKSIQKCVMDDGNEW